MAIKIETIASLVELTPLDTFIQRWSCQKIVVTHLFISSSVLKHHIFPKLGQLFCFYSIWNRFVWITRHSLHTIYAVDSLICKLHLVNLSECNIAGILAGVQHLQDILYMILCTFSMVFTLFLFSFSPCSVLTFPILLQFPHRYFKM